MAFTLHYYDECFILLEINLYVYLVYFSQFLSTQTRDHWYASGAENIFISIVWDNFMYQYVSPISNYSNSLILCKNSVTKFNLFMFTFCSQLTIPFQFSSIPYEYYILN